MTQTLRWTPQQLEDHLRKRHGDAQVQQHPAMKALQTKSRMQTLLDNQASLQSWSHVRAPEIDPIGSGDRPASPAQCSVPAPLPLPPTGACADRPIPRRIEQRARALASMDNATWTGSHDPGKHLEVVFHGVVLLSVNTLYGLTHYERVKYRKRWHDLIERAVLDLIGPAKDRLAFAHCIVRAHRVSRRLADTDAKSGYLKYPIDGLRYSGIMVEDTPAHFRDLLCSQSLGLPALALRIEAVPLDYVPEAMRGSWSQNMLRQLAPPSKPPKPVKASKNSTSQSAVFAAPSPPSPP